MMLTLLTGSQVFAQEHPSAGAFQFIIVGVMETLLSIVLCYIVWKQACSQGKLKDYDCFIE